jgi:hypothetical protein
MERPTYGCLEYTQVTSSVQACFLRDRQDHNCGDTSRLLTSVLGRSILLRLDVHTFPVILFALSRLTHTDQNEREPGTSMVLRIPMRVSLQILLSFMWLTLVGCRNEVILPPSTSPTHVPVIHLSVADTGLTDLWLRVRFDDTVQQRSWRLTRDGRPLLTLAQAPLDTVVLDDSLAVKRTYAYKAYRLGGTMPTDSTALLQATTLDTTSHNFFWQIDTLGDGQSVLYDVAIVNDTLVIACGELYLRDSLGGYQPPCGVAIWNGRQWQIRRLYAQYPSSHTPLRPEGIFAFSPTDVWFAWGDVFHWDGRSETVTIHQVTSILGQNQGIKKLWGTSGVDLYGVGTAGAIAHYNGFAWQRIESGTTLPINDIWGARNPVSGETEILAVASNKFQNQGKKLLRIHNGGAVSTVPDSGLSWSLSAVWFVPGRMYYICGDGIYPSQTLGPTWVRDETFPAIYKDAVRGSAVNDIVVSGSNGLLSHFNGLTWRHYLNSELPFFSGRYFAAAIAGRMVLAVGYINDRAIATIGRR